MCWVSDRDAVLVVAETKIVVVGTGGWLYDDAPLESASLAQVGELDCDLRLLNSRRRVHFRNATDVEAALREFSQARDLSGIALGHSVRLEPDERLVQRCIYLGGINVQVPVEAEVDLLFGSDDIQVHYCPLTSRSRSLAQLSYGAKFTVELSGPGRFTTGGGFVGGGIGMEGAAGGMAIAGILNALTTRTRVESVIAILSADFEGFFLCRDHDLDELRRLLAPVFLRARQISDLPAAADVAQTGAIGIGLVALLERLTALHAAGALTDQEFIRAKAQALGTSDS
jgi:hypothetical protein